MDALSIGSLSEAAATEALVLSAREEGVEFEDAARPPSKS